MKARRREKLTLDALDDLVGYLGGVREERKAVLTVSEGWVLFRENQNLTASQKGGDQSGLVDRLLRRPAKEKSEETGGLEGRQSRGVRRRPRRAGCARSQPAAAIADRGRQSRQHHVLCGRSARRPSMRRRPLRSRLAGVARRRTLASRQDSLRFIADNTDGLLVNASSTDAHVDRIVDDVSSYYLMTYSSSNTKLDGRFRAITVRVKRDGVKVRARRGYRGRPPMIW